MVVADGVQPQRTEGIMYVCNVCIMYMIIYMLYIYIMLLVCQYAVIVYLLVLNNLIANWCLKVLDHSFCLCLLM